MIDDVREKLRREFSSEEYTAVRELWKAHSLAEDGRDLEGLIATLTPDCVYEVVPTGHRWEGHDGARGFYRALLGAFPDVRFDLKDIVIGPQGVCEEARLTGGLPQFRRSDSGQGKETAKLGGILADEVKRLNGKRFRHFRWH